MSTIRKTMRLIGRENRWRLGVLIPLSLAVTGAEVVGASLVYVLLGLATGASDSADLPFVGDLRELFGLGSDHFTLLVAGAMGVFLVAKASLKVFQAYVQNRVVSMMGARLSTRMMLGYLSMPYAFHLHRTSSELIRNVNKAVGQVFKEVVKPLVRVLSESMIAVGMLMVLLTASPMATVLAVIVLGSTAVLLLKVVQPRQKRLGRRQHALDKETLQALQQSFHGVRDVKVLGAERTFSRRYHRYRRATARVNYLRATLDEFPPNIVELALFGFILVFFGTALMTGQNTPTTLTVLGLFAYVGQRIQGSIAAIVGALNKLKFAAAPIDDLYRDLLLIEQARMPEDGPPLPFSEAWVVDDVTFSYEAAHTNALEDVALTVHPGEVVGICGPTGGGKTTLVDVMTGLLEPSEGRVTVDGHDLREHARSWQRNLGVVPQMVFLTDDTLRANIALAVDDDAIDESALDEAVDLAQLREFVDSLPDGLRTKVGERGVRVSGGQRQRIAIARALYRRPSVLVFDEGTSALDNTTEREVMTALARLRGQHTILMIAHRLSTVRDADRIALVQNGRIVALGQYDELVATSPEFAALAGSP